jgi:hypothetical protein
VSHLHPLKPHAALSGLMASITHSKEMLADEKLVSEADGNESAEDIIIEDGLRRGLLGRHVSLISLASVIGASCFYGFGYALFLSGPLGALLGFGIIGERLKQGAREDCHVDNYKDAQSGHLCRALVRSPPCFRSQAASLR